MKFIFQLGALASRVGKLDQGPKANPKFTGRETDMTETDFFSCFHGSQI
jgi:hypothetical protein